MEREIGRREKEKTEINLTFDIFSLLINHGGNNLEILSDLYKNIEDISISSYYFLFQGIQYEYGINKSRKENYALEFYKQGANLNNFLCYYKLYLIFSDDYDNSNSFTNLFIIGDNKFYQSLFYLLKFFAYFDENSLISYFINFYNNQAEHFKTLKKLFLTHRKEFMSYLLKHQYDLNIEDREKEFLLINLNYLCDNDINEYLSKLFDLYKTNFHEETQYIIFSHLIKNNQSDSLENFLLNKFSLNGNIKIFAYLIKTFLYNLQVSKKDTNHVNHIINIISTEKKFWTRKLKFGCFYDTYAELKFYEIEIESLYDALVEDHYHKKEDSDFLNITEHFIKGNQFNNTTKSTSNTNILNKINKMINYLYKSLKIGNLEVIKNLFYLNLFTNKNYLSYSLESEEKVKIFVRIYEILDMFFFNDKEVKKENTLDKDKNDKLIDRIKFMSSDMIIILAVYYIKGIKIKKDPKKANSILNYLAKNKSDSLTINERILVNYFINKCEEKLRITNDSNYNLEFCLNCLSSISSEIKSKNLLDTTFSIQSLYYLIKIGLSQGTKGDSFKNSFSEAFQIIIFIGNFYSNSSNTSHCVKKHKISFTILDKIYFCKILKLLKTRKEFTIRENYLQKIMKMKTFDNISKINTNPCDNCSACMKNNKEALAVPCGHKFICYDCYNQLKDDISDLEYTCTKCNVKVESVIEKVYK